MQKDDYLSLGVFAVLFGFLGPDLAQPHSWFRCQLINHYCCDDLENEGNEDDNQVDDVDGPLSSFKGANCTNNCSE